MYKISFFVIFQKLHLAFQYSQRCSTLVEFSLHFKNVFTLLIFLLNAKLWHNTYVPQYNASVCFVCVDIQLKLLITRSKSGKTYYSLAECLVFFIIIHIFVQFCLHFLPKYARMHETMRIIYIIIMSASLTLCSRKRILYEFIQFLYKREILYKIKNRSNIESVMMTCDVTL